MNTIENKYDQKVKATAYASIAYVILMLGASLSLIFVFDFPDILREPVDVMLSAFYNNRGLIVPSYYLFVLSGIAFIFMVLLMHKIVAEKDSLTAMFALVFGILFGLTSNLGFIRWPFLMDYLAKAFNDPAVTLAQKEIIKITFDSFHNYAGVAVGENFAFWFEGFWMIFLSVIIKRRTELFPKYISQIGFVIGIGMLVYTLEQFGGVFSILGVANIIIHAGLLVWLLAISVLLLKSLKSNTAPVLGKSAGIILIVFYAVLLVTAYV